MCTWDPEYGDGYFQIDQNILGDFAIICRFGGQLANTREKSTLIFKYQNTTGEYSAVRDCYPTPPRVINLHI